MSFYSAFPVRYSPSASERRLTTALGKIFTSSSAVIPPPLFLPSSPVLYLLHSPPTFATLHFTDHRHHSLQRQASRMNVRVYVCECVCASVCVGVSGWAPCGVMLWVVPHNNNNRHLFPFSLWRVLVCATIHTCLTAIQVRPQPTLTRLITDTC